LQEQQEKRVSQSQLRVHATNLVTGIADASDSTPMGVLQDKWVNIYQDQMLFKKQILSDFNTTS
jgi:hypothetical protein